MTKSMQPNYAAFIESVAGDPERSLFKLPQFDEQIAHTITRLFIIERSDNSRQALLNYIPHIFDGLGCSKIANAISMALYED